MYKCMSFKTTKRKKRTHFPYPNPTQKKGENPQCSHLFFFFKSETSAQLLHPSSHS